MATTSRTSATRRGLATESELAEPTADPRNRRRVLLSEERRFHPRLVLYVRRLFNYVPEAAILVP